MKGRAVGAARAAVLGCGVLTVAVAVTPAAAKTRTVPDSGVVSLGAVRCEAAEACALVAPRQVSATVAGAPLRARVLAPPFVGRGGRALVKLRFDATARSRLAGRSAGFRLRVSLRAAGERQTRTFAVRLQRPAAPVAAPGGGAAPGAGSIHSEPVSGEAQALARPATAVAVSGVKLLWYPRDSWLRYAASGVAPGDGILIAGGASGIDSTASPCPDRSTTSDAQLPYTVEFAPLESWYDPLSGSAAIAAAGSVSFRWRAHTIDLTGSDPEIQINGASSQASFRFSGSGGTAYPNQRVNLLSLDSAGRPVLSNGGKTLSYELMRGRLTADGVKVFAGFYGPPDNDEFGCVSVSFTLP